MEASRWDESLVPWMVNVLDLLIRKHKLGAISYDNWDFPMIIMIYWMLLIYDNYDILIDIDWYWMLPHCIRIRCVSLVGSAPSWPSSCLWNSCAKMNRGSRSLLQTNLTAQVWGDHWSHGEPKFELGSSKFQNHWYLLNSVFKRFRGGLPCSWLCILLWSGGHELKFSGHHLNV